MDGKDRLEAHRIPNLPEGSMYYIPDFITREEEEYLIRKILESPQPKWKVLQNRRLQYWGGQLSSKNVLIPEPMPAFFVSFPDLVSRIANTGAFVGSTHDKPNHCLVNLYASGQGIMPHEDGAAYFPAVATISLGSHTLLDLHTYTSTSSKSPMSGEARATMKNGEGRAIDPVPIASIVQEKRSLLITTGDMYRSHLHGIAERTYDLPRHFSKVVNADLLADPNLRTAVQHIRRSFDLVARTRARALADGRNAGDVVGEVDPGEEESLGLERGMRISLTFRDVEKVGTALGSLLKR